MPTRTSETVKAELKAKLISEAQISTAEPVYTVLDDLLSNAYLEYAPASGLDFTLLDESGKENELVIILAWIRVCDSRASSVAPQSSSRGTAGGFGSDRDTPFAKNTALAKILRERYANLRAALAIGSTDAESGDITMGELVRHDEYSNAQVPFRTAKNLAAPILSNRTPTAVSADATLLGTVVLSWTKLSSEYFDELILLGSNTAGIYQDWNQSSSGPIPFSASDSSIMFRSTDNQQTATRITYLTAGDVYFVAAVRDTNGRYTFSNEIKVTIIA